MKITQVIVKKINENAKYLLLLKFMLMGTGAVLGSQVNTNICKRKF